MVRCQDRQKNSSQGGTFAVSLVFLFLLIGILRLCYTTTVRETKLTSMFVQQTQGYYLLENLMALTRDYVYQIVQNPRMPHLFLSASAFRTKDKASFKQDDGTYSDGSIIDFNGSLSKQQIVPDDFQLQVADDGWDIKGGPIFWQNKNNEHYLAEVFMIGSLNLVSNFIPGWKMRMVQTMEIERNPLCDFALYAEGDIGINSNIDADDHLYIKGLTQINGNFRCNQTNGEGNGYVEFLKKVNCAGYKLNIDDSINGDTFANFVLPAKYHMLDNHANRQVTKGLGSGTDVFLFSLNAINDGGSENLTVEVTSAHNDWSNTNYETFEQYFFAQTQSNSAFRSRVLRPIGFDPENYWGFWEPSLEQPAVSSGDNEDVDQDRQVLNHCFGFHSLAQNSERNAMLSRTGNSDYNPKDAMHNLRGLDSYQMTEKARLVEMQKAINHPAVRINLLTKNKASAPEVNSASLYIPNNFIYSTYLSNAFPAIQDNIYLNRYISLAFQSESIIAEPSIEFYVQNNATSYKYDCAEFPNDTTVDSICIDSNKMAYKESTPEIGGSHSLSVGNIVQLKSTFSPTGSSDDSCPPHKLIQDSGGWRLDNYVTRVSGEHYNFLYDRNRAKWIQLVDIDIGALTAALNADATWNGSTIQPIVAINTNRQPDNASNINQNYRPDDIDIRYNYASRRETFFETYRNGSYIYPNDATHPPVIDIGVRLINASTLPTKGLTFYCPYPLYIKGDFNNVNTKPALIITDSITVLPDAWQDWYSQMDPINSLLHGDETAPKICADIITGRTHPYFWIQSADTTSNINQTEQPNPDMGFHDAFRSLCLFDGKIDFHGSLMLPYFCQEQWEPPIDFGKTTKRDPTVYAYPKVDINDRLVTGIPAGMPFYYRINRGRKTHCLGNTAYSNLIGDTLYNKDWHSTANTFADYQTALPNYLK